MRGTMATLKERLEAMRNGSKLKPEIEAAFARYFSEAHPEPLANGSRIPHFSLPDHAGRIVSSIDLLQQGPLVITFFRGTWCPYCNAEMAALNDAYDSIRATGAELVAISPQSAQSAGDYRSEHPLKFSVLIDTNARVAESFGLAYILPDYLQAFYRHAFRTDLTAINDGKTWRLPVPGRFIADRDGTIVDVEANADYRFRPEPEAIVPILKRLALGPVRKA
ncbi:AhpC/TSA family protein [bacterium]|nr:MAG: AhpC/TSA family protein [bacterium]